MKEVLFIINQKAGRQEIKTVLADILNIFSENKIIPKIYITQKQHDAYDLVKEQGNQYDTILCCGGDGTLDEVVSGIVDSDINVHLGYIPAGSTNDFAHSIKIPSKMKDAAKVIVGENITKCDIGTFNNEHFVYVAAFGAFTEVSYKTSQDMKNMLGHMAYLLEGAKSLLDLHPQHVKVTVDGNEVEGNYLYGMVTNSKYVGGFKGITGKNVRLDDGLFEMVLVEQPNNPYDLQLIIDALTSNKDNNFVHHYKGKHFTFDSDTEVSWTRDGEDGGNEKHVDIKNLYQELSIITKAKSTTKK